MDGKAPDIDWADLEVASNILAELQNAEADRKKSVNEILVKLSHVLGTIMTALIKGLAAGGSKDGTTRTGRTP